jgi:hypothetical protein
MCGMRFRVEIDGYVEAEDIDGALAAVAEHFAGLPDGPARFEPTSSINVRPATP